MTYKVSGDPSRKFFKNSYNLITIFLNLECPLYLAFLVGIAEVKAGIKLELEAKAEDFFFGGRDPKGLIRWGENSYRQGPTHTYAGAYTLVFNQMRIHTHLSEHFCMCFVCE